MPGGSAPVASQDWGADQGIGVLLLSTESAIHPARGSMANSSKITKIACLVKEDHLVAALDGALLPFIQEVADDEILLTRQGADADLTHDCTLAVV